MKMLEGIVTAVNQRQCAIVKTQHCINFPTGSTTIEYEPVTRKLGYQKVFTSILNSFVVIIMLTCMCSLCELQLAFKCS